MREIIDFSSCQQTNTYYGGSERKLGILVDGIEFMLKFPKLDAFENVRTNHISEYIGSHIFALLGMPAQETHLGTYRGEEVVACKNFLHPNEQFVPFNDVGESSLERDRERYQYSYEDIIVMLAENRKLTNVPETIQAFWDMYIIDALLGNFDRHGANWGFIKFNNAYRMAPIFDNGSCLYPKIVDNNEMRRVISSPSETEKRIYSFPTSQIKLNGRKSSYYQTIDSLQFPECNKALTRIFERCDLAALRGVVSRTPFLCETKRAFLTHMLEQRYRLILEQPYNKLVR